MIDIADEPNEELPEEPKNEVENELVSLQKKIMDLESKLTFNKNQAQKQQN